MSAISSLDSSTTPLLVPLPTNQQNGAGHRYYGKTKNHNSGSAKKLQDRQVEKLAVIEEGFENELSHPLEAYRNPLDDKSVSDISEITLPVQPRARPRHDATTKKTSSVWSRVCCGGLAVCGPVLWGVGSTKDLHGCAVTGEVLTVGLIVVVALLVCCARESRN